ncbi:MAG: YdcF family protein, partial [Salaquimonas sp.]
LLRANGRGKLSMTMDGNRKTTGRGFARSSLGGLLVFSLKAGFYASTISALLLVVGFVWFQSQISSYEQYSRPTGEGIVVLTGGHDRVETGLKLLEKSAGEKLLISGVHVNTSKGAILAALGRDSDSDICCIDIGHTAKNTVGNAVEIAEWAKSNDFSKLIVVTSNYHLPRALMEIGMLLPDAELFPFAAQSAGHKKLNSDEELEVHPSSLRVGVIEYGKYLAAMARIWFGGTNPLTRVARVG